jgi:hypothetical protein
MLMFTKPHALLDASLQIFHLVEHSHGDRGVSIRHDTFQFLSQFFLFFLVFRQKQQHVGQRVRCLISEQYTLKFNIPFEILIFHRVDTSHEHVQRHDDGAHRIRISQQQFLQRAWLDALLPRLGVFHRLLHVLVAHTLSEKDGIKLLKIREVLH